MNLCLWRISNQHAGGWVLPWTWSDPKKIGSGSNLWKKPDPDPTKFGTRIKIRLYFENRIRIRLRIRHYFSLDPQANYSFFEGLRVDVLVSLVRTVYSNLWQGLQGRRNLWKGRKGVKTLQTTWVLYFYHILEPTPSGIRNEGKRQNLNHPPPSSYHGSE